MTTTYCAEFLERIERISTAVSYRFKKPKNFSFTPGQYMLVDLGNKLIHPLSLSNSPDAEFIEFTKRMSCSPYCERLKSLEKGEIINLKGPIGKFCLTDDSREPLVMIAGGIGITPIMSILKSLEKNRGNIGPVILIYGNMNKEDIAFKDELENLNLPDYHLIHVLLNPTGIEKAYQGFINADVISKEVPHINNANYMLSGPPGMIAAIEKALTTLDVEKDRISTDIFFGYS
jgi:ferredoxin-NADP reductase